MIIYPRKTASSWAPIEIARRFNDRGIADLAESGAGKLNVRTPVGAEKVEGSHQAGLLRLINLNLCNSADWLAGVNHGRIASELGRSCQ
jgi:hypothetical protein